jgi:HlyD family secretion protein
MTTTKNRSRWRRWATRTLMLLSALGIVALLVKASLPKPLEVDVAVIEQGPMKVTVDEDGRTRVKDRYIVSAPLGGNLGRLELQPGDEVEEGAVLARIIPLAPPLLDERSTATSKARLSMAVAARQQAAAQLERARVANSFAEGETKRARELFDSGALPKQQLDQADLSLRTAAADVASAHFASRVAAFEVEMAKAALEGVTSKGDGQRVDVRAPIGGKVLRVMRQDAGAVAAGTALLEVGDPKALEVVVDVLTRDAVTIQPGAACSVERWGGEPLAGRVQRVEPSAFTRMSSLGVEEQRVNVVIELVDAPARWATLGDGYRVEARIVIWEQTSVLVAPASSVFRHGEGWGLFVSEGDRAVLRTVTIGHRQGGRVEVVEGVSPGETVVLHPGPQLVAGTRIMPRQ